MRRSLLGFCALLLLTAVSAVTPVAVPPAMAANTLPTNPLGFAYKTRDNVALYGHPTGMLITGRCNRYADEFKTARANGAEILAYLNVVERNDVKVCDADDAFYGLRSTSDLWPYPTPGARTNWKGSDPSQMTHMLDIQVGHSWPDRAVEYIAGLMTEGMVDGVFSTSSVRSCGVRRPTTAPGRRGNNRPGPMAPSTWRVGSMKNAVLSTQVSSS